MTRRTRNYRSGLARDTQNNCGCKMNNSLQSELGSLAGTYTPVAVYFSDSDCVEYVKADGLCVYDRIDNFLTLITDENQRSVIGFKLKGFSKVVKHMVGQDATDDQFLTLIKVIESVCTELGDDLIKDDGRVQAYATAKKIAVKENIFLDRATLPPAFMVAASNSASHHISH